MVYVIPPSPTLLKDCPQFESLHKKLTLSMLDQDGAVMAETQSQCTSIQVTIRQQPWTLFLVNIVFAGRVEQYA